MADAFKAEGNKAFQAKDFDKAVELFSKAIELDPTNHVLYSNRSGSYASLKQFDKALEDAEKTTELKADWGKGWSRKGTALHGLGDLDGAATAFEKALEVEPTNAQAKQGLAAVTDAKSRASQQGQSFGLGQIFNDPNWIAKLAANPKTKEYLSDGDFLRKIQGMSNQQNPTALQDAISDPRIMEAISVILGLGTEGAAAEGASGDAPMPDAPPAYTQESKPAAKKEPEPEPQPEPEDTSAQEAKEAKAKADAEKALGTENYKKRNFDVAIEHYSKAWELHKDITYLNNLAAAKFEKGDLDGCIEECTRAIEEGREMRADYKLIGKAFARTGTAYQKKGDLGKAIEYYNRALTEHRTPDVLAKLRAVEKQKIEAEKAAYIDPVKAEEAREEGNKHFKEANWPEAVKCYTEMIKRAPQDPRGYSNLAVALTKLGSFPEAVRNCDAALKLDPKFMRAHIRKAQAYFAMREYGKCLDALTEATEADTDGKSHGEIEALQRKCLQTMYAAREGETEEQTMERIQRDPDIVSIIQDPVMQSILQQAKSNPAALNDHMKNPIVRQKIQKLMAAGIIRVG